MSERCRRDAASLLSQIMEALRERARPRYLMMEEYGPDGEIVKAWEGSPIVPGHEGVTTIIITGVGYAEPREDWRERGVVPPRGFHPSRWRD